MPLHQRNPFRHSTPDSDSDLPADMDEQEQEHLIHTLSATDAARTALYTRAFLIFPLLTSLLYAQRALTSPTASGTLTSLLQFSSLLFTALGLYLDSSARTRATPLGEFGGYGWEGVFRGKVSYTEAASPPPGANNPMFSRLARTARPPTLRSLPPLLRRNAQRTLVAAPKPGSGPLMSRRPDRELPALQSNLASRWLRTAPLFLAFLGVCTLAIFNYQKSSSSVVTSAMYALRTNKAARELLGDEIYFAHRIPWIWGSIDQLHGRIDIEFKFETQQWELKTEDGQVLNLMGAVDPFKEADMNS
ncbi:DUF1783-domain-containing protein [Trichodelitschia bisporula]|uniref:DUF1783-domain-containing protein n=1 Tax=Trichodelitschia bisporula TaxID=703511 RepID=A0A6G1HST3_9PEZI|nr:DUF1783-domain-containing protein [Trichodelitschia bisporula]